MSTHRRRMHRRWRKAVARREVVTRRIYAMLDKAFSKSLGAYTHKPMTALDGWRATLPMLDDAQSEFIQAAIRCHETGEPQRLAHGTVTKADPEAGSIHFTADAALERIYLTLVVGPESAA